MSKKPTYEDLEQRVKALEKGTEKLKHSEKALRESEQRYRSFIENFHGIAYRGDIETWRPIFFHGAVEKITGYTEEELIAGNLSWYKIIHPDDISELKGKDEIASNPNYSTGRQYRIKCKNGKIRWIYEFIKNICDEYSVPKFVEGAIYDITNLKETEEALQKAHDELELRVEERTRELELKAKSLEELNTAMKVILEKRKEDKTNLEASVMTNVKELIIPYFDKIKATKLDEHQKAFLSIIESNMNEIVSPFTRELSLKFLKLTPTEIKIANMIKHGITSKEIAKIMNISHRTVDAHRKNIRTKIGLKKKRANLRSHLLALQ